MAGAFQSNAFQNNAFQTDAAGTNRTASDALTASDAATRILAGSRTAADTATLSDDAVAIVTIARTAADATTVSDALDETLVLSRSAADAPSASDTATIAQSLARAATDTLTLSDEAEAVAEARTAADTVTTSDATTETKDLLRAADDTVSTSDATAETKDLARSIDDAVSTSDAATQQVVIARTVADTATLSDTATRAVNWVRTASDSVSATGTQAEPGSFSRSVIDRFTVHSQATIPGVELPSGEVVGQEPNEADVHVYIDGTEVTADVVFATARFRSMVNGQAGEAEMRLRDENESYSIRTGADWLLVIDGQAVWRGFVTQASRQYVFSATNIQFAGFQRFWDLKGSDLNLLFLRRVVHKKSAPEQGRGTQYPADTMDRQAIMDLINDWLTLEDDDLDTSTWVDQVAALDPYEKVRAWSGSWYWGDAMNSIATLPAAVWYIRPEIGTPKGSLVYADVDVPDSPYLLTDAAPVAGGEQTLFSDTFTRSVSYLLGGDYTDDPGGWSEAPVVVDGSKAVAGGANYGAATVWNTSIPHPAEFDLLFDISTPAAAAGNATYMWISLGKMAVEFYPIAFGTPLTYWFGGHRTISDTSAVSVVTRTNLALDPSSEYRVRARVSGNTAYVRIWKVGTTEPGTWFETWNVTGGFDAQFWMDFESSASGTTQTLDNLTVTSTQGTPVNRKTYREMEIILDATRMANDVLAWGMGYGSQVPVFKRAQSTTSQAEHGRWQTAVVKSGVYKQGTINRIATSILNGSPSSKRGAKDDRPSVSLVTYEPGFLAGQKVQFESNVWGWSDVLPIRDMEVTFESPTGPRYQLLLSHEIDQPWNSTNPPIIPGFDIPKPCLGWDCYEIKEPPPEDDCTDICAAMITDTFTRTIGAGSTTDRWGTSDALIDWYTYGDEPGGVVHHSHEVDGSIGIMAVDDGYGGAYSELEFAHGQSFSILTRFRLSEVGLTTGGGGFTFMVGTSPGRRWGIANSTALGSGDWLFLARVFPNSSGSNSKLDVNSWFTYGQWYWSRWECEAGVEQRLRIWEDGSAEPGTWTLTNDISAASDIGVFGLYLDLNSPSSGAGDLTLDLDDLDIDGVNLCDAIQFDDFNRTVASGLGTNLLGEAWTAGTVSSGTTASVNGSKAILTLPSHAYEDPPQYNEWEMASGPFNNPRWEMVCRFSPQTGGGSGPNQNETQWYIDDGEHRQTLTADSYSDAIYIDGPYSIVQTLDFSLTQGSWYWIRWLVDSIQGTTKVKCWQDGDQEPVAWLELHVGLPYNELPIDEQFLLVNETSNCLFGIAAYRSTLSVSTAGSAWFDSIEFYYDGMPCYIEDGIPVYGTGGIPTSATGYGCETLVRVTSTIYAMSTTFTANSTSVFVNGTLSQRGVGYTEDADRNSITFASAVGVSDVVYACYYAEGTR